MSIVGLCGNCEQVKKLRTKRKPLCHACYVWKLKKGYPRPKKTRVKLFCDNCNKYFPRRISLGRCPACYSYYKTHGKERPRRFFIKPTHCRNPDCGRPLENIISCAGRCWTCYKYRRIHGIDRSFDLCWRNGQRGEWCDCGNKASHVLRVTHDLSYVNERDNGSVNQEIHLCSSCFDMEVST